MQRTQEILITLLEEKLKSQELIEKRTSLLERKRNLERS
jgi:hypothetical protein